MIAVALSVVVVATYDGGGGGGGVDSIVGMGSIHTGRHSSNGTVVVENMKHCNNGDFHEHGESTRTATSSNERSGEDNVILIQYWKLTMSL